MEVHVEDAVRVRLDRFVLDALGSEALEERVEPGDGEGDPARARLRRVRLDEEPGVLIGVSPGTRPSAKRVPRRMEPSESARAGS